MERINYIWFLQPCCNVPALQKVMLAQAFAGIDNNILKVGAGFAKGQFLGIETVYSSRIGSFCVNNIGGGMYYAENIVVTAFVWCIV